MIDKVLTVIERHDGLAEAMSQKDAMNDMKAFTQMAREHRGLDEAVEVCKAYKSKYEQLQEDEEILNGDDPELKELVKDEIGPLKDEIAEMENQLKILALKPTFFICVSSAHCSNTAV